MRILSKINYKIFNLLRINKDNDIITSSKNRSDYNQENAAREIAELFISNHKINLINEFKLKKGRELIRLIADTNDKYQRDTLILVFSFFLLNERELDFLKNEIFVFLDELSLSTDKNYRETAAYLISYNYLTNEQVHFNVKYLMEAYAPKMLIDNNNNEYWQETASKYLYNKYFIGGSDDEIYFKINDLINNINLYQHEIASKTLNKIWLSIFNQFHIEETQNTFYNYLKFLLNHNKKSQEILALAISKFIFITHNEFNSIKYENSIEKTIKEILIYKPDFALVILDKIYETYKTSSIPLNVDNVLHELLKIVYLPLNINIGNTKFTDIVIKTQSSSDDSHYKTL